MDKNKREQRKIKLLLNLIKFMELKNSYDIPEELYDWFNYYQNFHLKWFSSMEDEKYN